MSFLSEKRAWEVFELYKEAELSNDNETAKALLQQLEDAKWKVVWSPKWGIEPEEDRLFSNIGNNQAFTGSFNNNVSATPYKGSTSATKKVPTWVWVTLAGVALTIIAIVVIVKIKKSRNGGFEKTQTGVKSL